MRFLSTQFTYIICLKAVESELRKWLKLWKNKINVEAVDFRRKLI